MGRFTQIKKRYKHLINIRVNFSVTFSITAIAVIFVSSRDVSFQLIHIEATAVLNFHLDAPKTAVIPWSKAHGAINNAFFLRRMRTIQPASGLSTTVFVRNATVCHSIASTAIKPIPSCWLVELIFVTARLVDYYKPCRPIRLGEHLVVVGFTRVDVCKKPWRH